MATPTPLTTPASSPTRGGRTKPDKRKWFALAATCFGLFMALLDVTIVNVALPTIQRDLHATFADLQWVISAYTLALAVFLVTAGRLGDIFGRKRTFMVGLGVFSLGSLLCALSGDLTIGALSHIDLLLGARALQGLGGAVMLPLSLAIISTTFQGKERGTAIGIWGGVTGLATAIGPLIGGVLVARVTWQAIFYLNVPIGIVGIALSAWAIRETRDERAARAVDLFGLVTISVSLFCLVLALIQGNDKGWTSPYILTLFGVAAVAVVAFVVGELRRANPMVDPRLFANASFTGAAIAAFTLSAGLYALFFFLTLYFQDFLGFSALDTGLRFLPLSALVLIAAPLAGAQVGRRGPRPILVAGMVLITVSVALMGGISSQHSQDAWLVLLPAFIIGGLGNGIVNPPISTIAVGTVSRARAGMASGVNGVCRQIGTAGGIAFLGAVLTARYNGYIHDKVLALRLPAPLAASITPQVKHTIITGIQQAGTIAGSLGLPNDPSHPNPYAHSPLAPDLQRIARASFIAATTDILHIAAIILAVGALASLILVKRSDLLAPSEGADAGTDTTRATRADTAASVVPARS